MERATIEIGGMSCGHCVGAVTRVLQELEGVRVEEVKIGSATVEYDPGAVTPERIEQAIGEEGYEARVAGGRG
ncbi:MAG TPA: cation transporter [Longimicrobiaceae bacterium]